MNPQTNTNIESSLNLQHLSRVWIKKALPGKWNPATDSTASFKYKLITLLNERLSLHLSQNSKIKILPGEIQ